MLSRRLDHLHPEDRVGQDHLAESTALTCTIERLTMHASCHKVSVTVTSSCSDSCVLQVPQYVIILLS